MNGVSEGVEEWPAARERIEEVCLVEREYQGKPVDLVFEL